MAKRITDQNTLAPRYAKKRCFQSTRLHSVFGFGVPLAMTFKNKFSPRIFARFNFKKILKITTLSETLKNRIIDEFLGA